MPAGVSSFADLLEEQLAGWPLEQAAPRQAFVFTPILGFFYFGPDGAPPAAAAAAPAAAPAPRWHQPEARPVPPSASRRMLSVTEQRAFDLLVQLGADLTVDFTAETLRSAFRKLAFQYHPDRHSHLSERDRARSATLFARAHDAYRELQPRTTLH